MCTLNIEYKKDYGEKNKLSDCHSKIKIQFYISYELWMNNYG